LFEAALCSASFFREVFPHFRTAASVLEVVESFHDAALKGCDECADFTGYCADLTVGSVG
jgi:hypothetical protein